MPYMFKSKGQKLVCGIIQNADSLTPPHTQTQVKKDCFEFWSAIWYNHTARLTRPHTLQHVQGRVEVFDPPSCPTAISRMSFFSL